MSRSPFAELSDAPMIARAFIQNLIDAIGSDKIAIVVERNKKETDPSICHSHDFCDANVFMDQALEDCWFVSFSDILEDELSEDDFNEQSDEICNVTNAARDIAKNADFNIDNVEINSDEDDSE